MEYQVPQFIEIEDKVVGPLTLKQFIFIAGGIGLAVGLFLYLKFIGILLALPILVFSFALAFYKVNNKSFTEIVEAAFNYYIGGRLYLWKKDEPKEVQAAPVASEVTREKLGLTQGKLHDLAWSLDIKDHQPQ